MSEFANIPLDTIIESTFNPRKNFNPEKLAELAESIKASGVLQPILVRPLTGARVIDTDRSIQFEIIAGARRFRASELAGLQTIPAIVRAMSNDAAMEAVILENLQRDDLTELEEAEGYDALMQHAGINADQVGSKIGKSRSYVYGRLKLLDLSHECKQALRAGQIDASRALLIARIPDSTLQTKALAEATRIGYRGDVSSVRDFQAWLQTNVMLRLEQASFRIADSTLVKAAGSCKDCPKRTGANPDLFADVDGADICTDPVCFHAKEDAQRANMLATAEAKGMRLIEGKEAKEICHQYRDTLKGYLPLSQVRSDLVNGDEAKLGTLLGKDAPPAVLIENPWSKELIAAVPTAEAEAVLVLKGLIKAVQQDQDDREDLDSQLATLKQRTDADIERKARANMFDALCTSIRATPDADARGLISNDLLRAYMLFQVGEWDDDNYAQWLGIDIPEELSYDAGLTHLRLHIQACDSAKLWRALAISMIAPDSKVYVHVGQPVDAPTLFEPMADALGIDLTTIKDNTAADVKQDMAAGMKRIKAEIKALDSAAKLNADALKAGIPIAPLAPPTPDAGKAKPARKGKISAAEAQASIAAAMQDQEGGGDGQAGEDAGDNAPNGWRDAFEVGQQVRVTTDDDKLGLVARKWAGKTGTITRREDGGGYWDVSFKGRGGGVAMFAEDQIAGVQP